MKKVVLIVAMVILSLGIVYSFATIDNLKVANTGLNCANFENQNSGSDYNMITVGVNSLSTTDPRGKPENNTIRQFATPSSKLVKGNTTYYDYSGIDTLKAKSLRAAIILNKDYNGEYGNCALAAGNNTQFLRVSDNWSAIAKEKITDNLKYYYAADIKPVNVTGFTGFVAYTYDAALNNPAIETDSAVERGYSWSLPLNQIADKYTGFGFTFFKSNSTADDAKKKIRLFINGYSCNSTNANGKGTADYLDINPGLGDLTAAWHNYAMFIDPDRSLIYFAIDGKVYGIFYVDHEGQLHAGDTSNPYFVSIIDNPGEYTGSCFNDGKGWQSGNEFLLFPDTFAWVGSSASGCEIYMDNIATGHYNDATDVGNNQRIDITQSGEETILGPKANPTDPMLSGLRVVVNSHFDVYVQVDTKGEPRDNYKVRVTPKKDPNDPNPVDFSELILDINESNECSFRYIDFDEIYMPFDITLLKKDDSNGDYTEILDNNNAIKAYTQLSDWTIGKYLMFDLVLTGNKEIYTLAADIARLGSAIRVYFYDAENDGSVQGWLTPMASIVNKNSTDGKESYKPEGKAGQYRSNKETQTISVQLHIDYDFKLRFYYNIPGMATAKMYKVNADGSDGEEVKDCYVNLNDNCVSTPNISITDLKTRYKVYFYDANNSLLAYIRYSVQDYIYNKFSASTQKHKDVVQSVAPLFMYDYYDEDGNMEIKGCAKLRAELALQKEIDFLKNNDVTLHFHVAKTDGTEICSNEAEFTDEHDKEFCTQSTIKAPYICSYFEKRVDAENVYNAWYPYIREIIVDSNDDTYMSFRDGTGNFAKEGAQGYAGLDAWCKECGISGCDVAYPKDFWASDMAKLWKKIYDYLNSGSAPKGTGEHVSLAELFTESRFSAINDTLGSKDGYTIWSKSGWENGLMGVYENTDGAYRKYTAGDLDASKKNDYLKFSNGNPSDDEFSTNDTGVVQTPNGDYIIVIFTDIPFDTIRLHGLINAIDDYCQNCVDLHVSNGGAQ